jgi:hypothetical protein
VKNRSIQPATYAKYQTFTNQLKAYAGIPRIVLCVSAPRSGKLFKGGYLDAATDISLRLIFRLGFT